MQPDDGYPGANAAPDPTPRGPTPLTPFRLWRSSGLVAYPDAMARMDDAVAAIQAHEAPETAWFLEHPPLYTAGISARRDDLLWSDRFPVYDAGRGGQFTYHGPGQRVVYVMADLRVRGRDVRAYVQGLETWLIAALAQLGLKGETRPDRVGVWIDRGDGREDKIAAIGVKVRRWVTLHGVALNVSPDLSHFAGIVPCGIRQHGVTSLADLGAPASMDAVDNALINTFEDTFGPLTSA